MTEKSPLSQNLRTKKKRRITLIQPLKICGYPKWAIERVKKQISHRKEKKRADNPKSGTKNKHDPNTKRPLVVLPYVQGTTEAIQRILKQHNITTSVRPNTTLRKLLVSPKDKVPKDKQCG